MSSSSAVATQQAPTNFRGDQGLRVTLSRRPQPYTPQPETRTKQGLIKCHPELIWALILRWGCRAARGSIGLHD